MHSLTNDDLRALSKIPIQIPKPAVVIEKPKKSSFLAAPSSLGITNLLFGQNENEKAAEIAKAAEVDTNHRKSNENSISGNAKNYFSAGVSRVFKRTSDGTENRTEKIPSAQESPSSSSSTSFFSPFAAVKKDQLKLDENIADVCELLNLLEICFMHGIRVKEFHGVLPLWTLLERLRLLTPQVVASMPLVDSSDDRGGGSKSELNNNLKNGNAVKSDSSKSGSDQEIKKNTNSKDIMSSIRNKFDHLSHHSESSSKSSNDNSNLNDKHTHNNKSNTTSTDSMTPVLTSNPLRQSVGAIAALSFLRSPVAKARAWLRCRLCAHFLRTRVA